MIQLVSIYIYIDQLVNQYTRIIMDKLPRILIVSLCVMVIFNFVVVLLSLVAHYVNLAYIKFKAYLDLDDDW